MPENVLNLTFLLISAVVSFNGNRKQTFFRIPAVNSIQRKPKTLKYSSKNSEKCFSADTKRDIKMQKAKAYDWQDSNMALFGSKEDRDTKKASAETEEAWKGCGQKVGIEIWRINKFQVGHDLCFHRCRAKRVQIEFISQKLRSFKTIDRARPTLNLTGPGYAGPVPTLGTKLFKLYNNFRDQRRTLRQRPLLSKSGNIATMS